MTEKIADLIKQLNILTNEGKVKWEETAKRNFYQCSFPQYSVQIGEFPDQLPELQFVFRLINMDNVVMEEASPSDLYPFMADAVVTMREMHTAARREALGTNKALDDILSSLKEKVNIEVIKSKKGD